MVVIRNGRWFWWLLAACLAAVVADAAEVGPFAGREQPPEVEVLGDEVERDPVSTTSTVAGTSTTLPGTDQLELPAGLDQATLDALEELRGLDRGTLDALESIRGIDPSELTSTTSAGG